MTCPLLVESISPCHRGECGSNAIQARKFFPPTLYYGALSRMCSLRGVSAQPKFTKIEPSAIFIRNPQVSLLYYYSISGNLPPTHSNNKKTAEILPGQRSKVVVKINLSMARFMKGFKTLFQELTDLVYIIMRLFPSGSSKARGFICHLYNISFISVVFQRLVLIRDMSEISILHRKSIGEATPPSHFLHTYIPCPNMHTPPKSFEAQSLG